MGEAPRRVPRDRHRLHRALFIAGLAFPDDAALLDQAKVGILAGSFAAGIAGALVLRATPPVPR